MKEFKREIKEEDLKDFVWVSKLSRLHPSDVTKLKNIYHKYINWYKNVLINWSCSSCIREVVKELLSYRDRATIITKKKGGRPKGSKNKSKKNESKNTKRKSSSKSRKKS